VAADRRIGDVQHGHGLVLRDHLLADMRAYAGGTVPKPGDVILFYPPTDLVSGQAGRRMPFIKRVMGVPGDRIQMIDGTLTLARSEPESSWFHRAPIS
jgi:signal peptidase I